MANAIFASSSSTNPGGRIGLKLGLMTIPYTLSPFEMLPTEIIQEAFFQCLEVNMPRASSPVLGAALSNNGIYKALLRDFLMGFEPPEYRRKEKFEKIRRLV